MNIVLIAIYVLCGLATAGCLNESLKNHPDVNKVWGQVQLWILSAVWPALWAYAFGGAVVSIINRTTVR